ncbi:protein STRUBBELIG-RECEPTOR FAMILY 3-like isoform X2 [Rhodamnia argentea]|uniref:Protein STRUBBELIG-RECEPTOR FAMILY 3-like isoform X2 n=1 Tax=Rhodamnia argentea TaxID=178133 RepID=A0A8B8Q908_9MYRT|nr:protein STRUBBELIG-RECEPTOR FAMILY 3-like isoform X2 [Rhodamnia argentea]
MHFGVASFVVVAAINSLYVSLGYPPLRGWLLVGGDPCSDGWQGVECVISNITGLNLSGANLGGELGLSLDFASLLSIDFSNNRIGGSVPSHLPRTVLSMLLGNNLFRGEIPDLFKELTSLAHLDLSSNNLTGHLPPSMGNLSAVTTLHLQNNKLIGTLNVLEDLPLVDLDIENNLFSGPIPPKLLTIPIFKKGGNPFNTSVIPSPSASPAPEPTSAPAPFIGGPPSHGVPSKQGNGSSAVAPHSAHSEGGLKVRNVILIAGVGVLVVVAIASLCLCLWRCSKRKQMNETVKRHEMGVYANGQGATKSKDSSRQPNINLERYVPRRAVPEPLGKMGEGHGRASSSNRQMDVTKTLSSRQKKDQVGDASLPMQPVASLLAPPIPDEKVIVNPAVSAQPTVRKRPSERAVSSPSVPFYSIASLQEFTNSFSPENFVGEGTLGSVYKAVLPDGRLLAVKKLKATVSGQQSNDKFGDLVSRIYKLRHSNIVELVGYCAEHAQRLLIYQYCRNGTLSDALHVDDEVHGKLSWAARIRVAIGAARALQYLHEVCQPPVVYRNFNSTNILLDDKLEARVSDCGLASLISSGSGSQLSEHLNPNGYTAPESELGTCSWQSDVYSFGVVMLELLTGRKSLDRSRPRGEQFLVRWAIPQLHDIDALSKMVDPSLSGFYPTKSLSRFADIISRCVQREPEFRPPMSEVVQDLLRMM